jgi:hypothetical protein
MGHAGHAILQLLRQPRLSPQGLARLGPATRADLRSVRAWERTHLQADKTWDQRWVSAREADNFDTCFRTYRTHRDNGDTARYEYLPEDRDQAPSDGAVSLAKTDSVGGLSPKETE